jgi:hypothetical protein
MRASYRSFIFIASFFVLSQVFTVGFAQTTGDEGSIRGRVLDPSGAIISNASVSAKSPYTAGTYSAVSDEEGNYRLLNLPPGDDYTVTVDASGFAKFERTSIVVRAGLNIALDINLQMGTEAQTVTAVAGETPMLETLSAVQSINLDGEVLRNLPQTGRREWSDVFQLTPGIVSASSDAEGGQTYFIRGSENENHATLLDGIDIGSFGQNWPSNYVSLSTEALGDVKITTGVADASAPSAMGMVINLATPGGADRFHGAAAFAFTPESWNANNTPGGISPISQTRQPDFSIGGPIKRGKAWFFGSARYIWRNDGISRPALQLSQLRALDPTFQTFANQSRAWVYVINGTVDLSDRHKLHGLFQRDARSQGANYQWYGSAIAPGNFGGSAYALRLTSNWTQNLLTSFLIGYNNKGSNTDASIFNGLTGGPEVNIYTQVNPSAGTLVGNGLIATLNNLSSYTLSPSQKPTASGDLTYYLQQGGLGTHEIKTGFYLQPHMRQNNTTIYSGNGYDLEEEVLVDPNNPSAGVIPFHKEYVTTPRLVTSYIGANDYAVYVQDMWRPTTRLTLTGGLRADWVSGQDLLFKISTQSSWNIAPRIGGAYVLTANQRNIVKANWGHVTDIPNASYLGTAGSNVAGLTDTYSLNLDGNFSTVIQTPASTSVSRNHVIDPDRHQGYVDEWSVGYQTQFKGQTTLDVSYIDRAYKDRPALVDINGIYNGNVFAGYQDPTQNNIYLVTNNHWNWFVWRGLQITAAKQARKLHYLATYTLAFDHIAGTWQPHDPAFFIQPNAFANNAGLGSVRGNDTSSLGADTRDRMWEKHILRTAVSYDAPWKLKLSTEFTAQSGTPTGPVTTNIAAPDPQFGPATLIIDGRTVSNPLATTTRFAFANRGLGQLYCPWLNIWNTRVGREFPISDSAGVEISFDIFNITNNGAGQQFVTNGNQINSTNYGQLTNIQLPRTGQFVARFHF